MKEEARKEHGDDPSGRYSMGMATTVPPAAVCLSVVLKFEISRAISCGAHAIGTMHVVTALRHVRYSPITADICDLADEGASPRGWKYSR